MKILLSGSAKEVEKVMRENRIREARGLIKFEPVPAEPAVEAEKPSDDAEAPVVTDTKEPTAEDAKEPVVTDTKTSKKSSKK